MMVHWSKEAVSLIVILQSKNNRQSLLGSFHLQESRLWWLEGSCCCAWLRAELNRRFHWKHNSLINSSLLTRTTGTFNCREPEAIASESRDLWSTVSFLFCAVIDYVKVSGSNYGRFMMLKLADTESKSIVIDFLND